MESFFKEILDDKDDKFIIFDVGARDCLESIKFYEHFKNSQIYSFECNPNTLEICKKNIEPFKDRITLIEGAVCDYDGIITFYPINQQKTITSWKDGNPGASSIFKSNGTYPYEYYVQDEIQTKCHRLDTIIKKLKLDEQDFKLILWMDLQGAELLALKSLGKYINNVKYIYTEVSHSPIYEGQVLFYELNDFLTLNGFILKNNLTLRQWQEDAIYVRKKSTLFDIVIPVGPKDLDIITEQIVFTKKNIIDYRNIYLISCDPTLSIPGCITIDENIFPFNLKTVQNYHGISDRNGWYLQQLLKLYAGFVIPDILDKYLVIDTDTYFLNPTKFIDNGCLLYDYSQEYHLPYFAHMQKLHPSMIKVDKTKSGICNHMIFDTKIIKEIFGLVEQYHKDTFYNVFLKNVNSTDIETSGASEYEIYFNYILRYHSKSIRIRKLRFGFIKFSNKSYDYNQLKDVDFVSYHWYMR